MEGFVANGQGSRGLLPICAKLAVVELNHVRRRMLGPLLNYGMHPEL